MMLRTPTPPDGSSRSRPLLFAERGAWAFGLVCVVTWGALYTEGASGARYELERFAILQAAAEQETATPDLSLWSPVRISAWRSTLKEPGTSAARGPAHPEDPA